LNSKRRHLLIRSRFVKLVSLPVFTVVAGANGAGKTTLTRFSREELQDIPILDPDAIARTMLVTAGIANSGVGAGREVLRRANALLDAAQSFLVETTLSGHTYLRMMERAKTLGFIVAFFYVGTRDISINMERVRMRVRKGGHDVPEEDQRRRFPRSFANMRLAFALADEAVLLDNSTSEGYLKVVTKTSTGITLHAPLPAWAEFSRF
jgi:predicted ABC-type ATPase